MKTIILNDELELAYPDSFRVLGKEERSRLNFIEEGSGECLKDDERHILISAGWKKTGGFVSLLADTKGISDHNETAVRKAMAPYGYENDGHVTADIGGKTSEGFLYHYQAQGIPMSGECRTVKNGRTIYYLNAYYRTARQAESAGIVKDILGQAKWR